MFQSLFKAQNFLYPNWNNRPTFIMSDFAPQITKVIKTTFPATIQLKCRFHFWNIVNPKLKNYNFFEKAVIKQTNNDVPNRFKNYFNLKLKSKRQNHWDPRRIFRYDISVLAKLPTQDLFKNFLKIIKPFWRQYSKKFLDYFQENFLDDEDKAGWVAYLSKTMPKTNNQNECYNNSLKEFVTKRQIKSFLEI